MGSGDGSAPCSTDSLPVSAPTTSKPPAMATQSENALANQWAMDHRTTLAGAQPILALDMYEHSYHMDYGAKAAAYVEAFMAAINWPNVARAYGELRQ